MSHFKEFLHNTQIYMHIDFFQHLSGHLVLNLADVLLENKCSFTLEVTWMACVPIFERFVFSETSESEPHLFHALQKCRDY